MKIGYAQFADRAIMNCGDQINSWIKANPECTILETHFVGHESDCSALIKYEYPEIEEEVEYNKDSNVVRLKLKDTA